MSVRVLFFGATASIASKREVSLPVAKELTASQVLAEMVTRNPDLAKHKLHISLNQQYADGSEPVRDGDELAIFTAVSGG